MKYLFLILTITLFSSCISEKKTTFIISNNTGAIIDTIMITYGTEKESKQYIKKNINPGQNVETVLDMNLKGVDGGYTIEIFQKEGKKDQFFGYYANAAFKNSIFKVRIEKDTLIINKI